MDRGGRDKGDRRGLLQCHGVAGKQGGEGLAGMGYKLTWEASALSLNWRKEVVSMREDLLQFIWQFRYFNQFHLFTEAGEEVLILFPGELNTDAGPDFRNARIRINGALREGPVELHMAASDWEKHGHDGDANYKNTILHVVWENDGSYADIPVLVLQDRVSKLLLGQYEKWMRSRLFVPCAAQLIQVDQVVMASWKELLLLRRLQRRAPVLSGLVVCHTPDCGRNNPSGNGGCLGTHRLKG